MALFGGPSFTFTFRITDAEVSMYMAEQIVDMNVLGGIDSSILQMDLNNPTVDMIM